MRWLRGRVGTDRDGLYLYFSAPHCAVRRRESRLVWWWMNGEAEGKARGDSAKLLARNSLHNNARHTHSRGFLPNSKSHATQTRQSTCHTPPLGYSWPQYGSIQTIPSSQKRQQNTTPPPFCPLCLAFFISDRLQSCF